MGEAAYVLRKVLHAFFGMITLFLALEIWTTWKMVIFRWILVGALLLFFIIDYFRIEFDWKFPLYQETGKEREQGHMHGMTYGAIGTVLCFLLFDFTIAITALAMQYFGDPASAIAGKYFGKRKLFRNKTFIGSFAMLIVSSIAGYTLLESWKLTAAMALTATFTELILDRMDDNLIVPITTGAVGALFSVLWSIP